jgi:FixJ family two-component response regulator
MKSVAVPTVFIVDDDRGMRQAIQDPVQSVGLRAEAFATGQDFLRRPLTSNPSCLVLDVRLPHMSGLDFQRQLAETGVQIPSSLSRPTATFPCLSGVLKSGAVDAQ